MDDFERMLFEYLVTVSVAGLGPQLAVLALVVAVAMLAIAVSAVLLQLIGVLRFRAAPSVLAPWFDTHRPTSTVFRGPARARAPSIVGEFARA